MKNSALIRLEDEVSFEDIYTNYGVSFIKGSYIKLLSTGEAKKYVTNESRLEHGTRYVITPALTKIKERKISVEILLEADTMQEFVTRYESFMARITNGYFYLKIPSRYRILKLVYSKIEPKQEYRHKKATFTLELVEPNPTDRIVIE